MAYLTNTERNFHEISEINSVKSVIIESGVNNQNEPINCSQRC